MADALVLCGYSKVSWSTKPAGAIIVANTLRDLGLTAAIVDHVFAIPRSTLFQLIEKFVDQQTSLVCLSTTLLGPSGDLTPIMHDCDLLFEPIMEKIKSINPNIKFVVGGSKITRGERSGLPFDYYIRGQAEKCVPALIDHLVNGTELTLDAEGCISDKIYDFEHYSSNKALSPTWYDGVRKTETLPMELGRGCVFKCSFCDYNLIGKKLGDFTKTAETFYTLLMRNYEMFGTTRYQFSDDTLNDSQEKIDLLSDVSEKLPFQMEFGAYMRLEMLDKCEGSAKQLMDAGLRGANLGVESLNREAGPTVGKGYGMKAVGTLERSRAIWGPNVAIHVNIIIGLPNDSKEKMDEQHQILMNAPWLDHVVYSALQISKHGDSMFSQGLYQKYYEETTEINEFFQKQLKTYEKTRAFFRESINWKSPLMNMSDAILLARGYEAEFRAKRKLIVNHVSAFSVMSLLESLTMEQIRTLEFVENSDLLRELAIQKIKTYTNTMLNLDQIMSVGINNIKVPVVNPTKTHFVSRIQVPAKYVIHKSPNT